MSQDQQQQSPMLDVDTAYSLVHQQVYAPVFFEKLASDFGIQPRTEQEAMEMLTMAAQLREAHEQNLEKSGADQSNILSAARQHLQGALANEGFQFAGPSDQQVKQAAHAVSQNPQIAHAVLSLQAGAAGITPDQLVGDAGGETQQ